MVNGYKPASLEEALTIRAEQEVIPYAGGTDLMIEGDKEATYLFVGKLNEIRQITEDDAFIRIGGACTFTEVLTSPLVPAIMKEAVALIAAPAIRNAGTMGGNIGNGSAKADSVLIEYALDARLVLSSIRGARIVSIMDFYQGRKKLDLQKDELITEILLPKGNYEHYYYKKVGARNALAISRIAFAGVFLEEEGRIKTITPSFGAVSATVLRFPAIEAMLIGKTKEEAKALKKSFLLAYEEAIVPTKGRVSAEYRKAVCINLLRDFLDEMGI